MSIEEYRRLNDSEESVVDFLASDDTVDLEEFLSERSFSALKSDLSQTSGIFMSLHVRKSAGKPRTCIDRRFL
ncbi:MAG: hypothetical protein M3R43_07680 [Acidobacteriota bacterium]|nr:hypothetical protein [Acidobacteriota bacterium]